MADEIRVQPATSETARAEIERTRARMSETIDEIEETILRTREDLRKKLDVLAKIREKPLQSAGIALGAGLILGLLTGGRRPSPADPESIRRAERWEARARRLLSIARDQEDEIDELRALLDDAARALSDELEEVEDGDVEFDEADDEPSWMAEMKDTLSERIEDFVAASVTTVMDALKRPPKRRRGR